MELIVDWDELPQKLKFFVIGQLIISAITTVFVAISAIGFLSGGAEIGLILSLVAIAASHAIMPYYITRRSQVGRYTSFALYLIAGFFLFLVEPISALLIILFPSYILTLDPEVNSFFTGDETERTEMADGPLLK